MLRRLLSWSLPAAAVIGAGALASACSVTPVAVSVGSESVSTSTINGELSSFTQSSAGGCLLQLEHQGLTSSDVTGTGSSGTYSMTLATQVVDDHVGDLVADQYAASRGITVTSSEVATAKTDYEAILDGEISAAAQSSSESGLVASCAQPDGQAYSGAQLVQSLPPAMATQRIHTQAVDEQLLARGADLSAKAVADYYQANRSLFTEDCVSVIVTAIQASAQQIVNQLNFGGSFSALAQAHSIDTSSASKGGSLGCDFTESEVLQSLDIQSAPVGTPIGPVQDTTSGQWDVYEVTSQVVQPLATAAPLVRRELLLSSANENRVGAELRVFAGRSDVYVNPQYGSWKGLAVVAPTPPPAQYLLAASTGSSEESNEGGSHLQLNGGSGG